MLVRCYSASRHLTSSCDDGLGGHYCTVVPAKTIIGQIKETLENMLNLQSTTSSTWISNVDVQDMEV